LTRLSGRDKYSVMPKPEYGTYRVRASDLEELREAADRLKIGYVDFLHVLMNAWKSLSDAQKLSAVTGEKPQKASR
jgi:hypothetical protein